MTSATQARIAALASLAAETQQRVTARGLRPHHKGKTTFKVATLVEVERSELYWLAMQVTLSDDVGNADLDKLAALRSGSAQAKGATVAIQLADLHWLLAFFPEPDPAADHAADDSDELDTVLADAEAK